MRLDDLDDLDRRVPCYPDAPAEPQSERPGRPHRLGARELLRGCSTAASFVSWDEAPLDVAEPGSAYAAEVAAAAERAGTDEAITVTGEGRIHGHRVAVVVGEFRFLAGSIGRAAAERVTLASSAPPASACRSSPPASGALGCRRAHRHS